MRRGIRKACTKSGGNQKELLADTTTLYAKATGQANVDFRSKNESVGVQNFEPLNILESFLFWELLIVEES